MIFELEQECLQAYRRKVDQASQCQAQLRQAVADSDSELAFIYAALGERPMHVRQVRSQEMKLCFVFRRISPCSRGNSDFLNLHVG